MLQNLGISTSYFAAKGLTIYDSVVQANKLGFRLIELGANHDFEENIAKTLEKICQDFPDAIFTQHCYFPPTFEKEFFSNAAEGLTPQNKQVLDSIFSAAEILKSKIVSFHSGLNTKFTYKGRFRQWEGFKEFSPTEKISQEEALEGTKEFFQFALVKAKNLGAKVAIENIVGRMQYPTTLTTFSDFKNFLNQFPDLNFLFDFGHGFIVHKDPYQFFSLSERIVEMHLDDVTADRLDHRVLGSGVLDLNKLFLHIGQQSHLPFLILEHSAEVKEKEIRKEVKLVEKYLGR